MAAHEGEGRRLPEADALLGQTVGGVRLETILPGSGRARVFRGTQQPIGRAVVVKLLPPLAEDEARRAAQLREVQILSQVRHPNVVTLYHVGVFDGVFPYFVTEFVQGGTLRALMRREGAQRPARALGLLSQVASALEELHRQGIVHRQLSPENILLEELVGSRQELVKVSGFGLAGASSSEGEGLHLEGLASPCYASPEQVLGGGLSEVSDLYACGVILFELLTGQLPYASTTPPALWDAIVRSPPPSLAREVMALGMHVPLQQLTQRLMAKQPADRLSSAHKLRLLAIRLREDLLSLTPDEAGRSNDQFPVLVTAARLKAIGPADWGEAAAPPPQVEARRGEAPAPRVTGARRVSVDRGEVAELEWLTPFPQRAARASGERYVVLSASSGRGERLTWKVADGAEVLQEATLSDGGRLLAVALPIYPERWLARLAQRARLDGFAVGMASAQGFPGEGGRPDEEATALAALCARAAQSGEIITPAASVAALGLAAWFEPTGLGAALELARFRAAGS